MIALSTALLALVGSFAAAPVSAQVPDLETVLAGNGNISTYYSLIKTFPDIILQLPNYAGVTIVAPNNDAFTKAGYFQQDNQTQVTNILEYHILQGTLATAAVPLGPADYAATLLKDPAYTNVTTGQNLIIYEQPGPVIVFTSGEGSRSTLMYGDIPFTGGLVQIVDTLLVPPSRLEPTCRDAYKDLTAFLGALYTAGIVEEFAESKDVTIFAPNNAAFQELAGTLATLDKASLAQVLRYHMVPGHVMPSSTLKNNTNLTSAAAGVPPYGPALIHVMTAGNNLYLDSAQMIQPDILIANGVVHMIDSVMNPNATNLLPNPALGTQAPAFALTGATQTGLDAPTPYISALPCTVSCPVPTTANSTSAPPTDTASATVSQQTYSSHAAAGALPPGLAGAAGMLGVGVVAMQLAGII